MHTRHCKHTSLHTQYIIHAVHCTNNTRYTQYTVRTVHCTHSTLYMDLVHKQPKSINVKTGIHLINLHNTTVLYLVNHITLHTLCTIHTAHCTSSTLYTQYTVHTVQCTLYMDLVHKQPKSINDKTGIHLINPHNTTVLYLVNLISPRTHLINNSTIILSVNINSIICSTLHQVNLTNYRICGEARKNAEPVLVPYVININISDNMQVDISILRVHCNTPSRNGGLRNCHNTCETYNSYTWLKIYFGRGAKLGWRSSCPS